MKNCAKFIAVAMAIMMLLSSAAFAEEFGSNPSGKIVEWSQGEKVMKYEKSVVPQVFPNVEYDYVLVNNNDFLTKLMSAVNSQTDVPDIVSCEVSNRGALFAMDILEDLEADHRIRIQADRGSGRPTDDGWIPAVVQRGKRQGPQRVKGLAAAPESGRDDTGSSMPQNLQWEKPGTFRFVERFERKKQRRLNGGGAALCHGPVQRSIYAK